MERSDGPMGQAVANPPGPSVPRQNRLVLVSSSLSESTRAARYGYGQVTPRELGRESDGGGGGTLSSYEYIYIKIYI